MNRLDPRRPALSAGLAVLAAGLVATAALAGTAFASTAARGMAVVLLLAAGAWALGRRTRPEPVQAVILVERHALGKETGVALVAAQGGRWLVGHGPAGVTLLAELRVDSKEQP